jgi:hypothetical protein
MPGKTYVGLLVVCVLGLFAMPVMAQPYPGAPGYPGGAQAARQKVNTTHQQLKDTQAAVDKLTTKAKAKLASSSPEWVKAQEAVTEARKHRDEVREQTLTTLHDSADYKALQEKLAQADNSITQFRESKITSSKEFDDAVAASFDTRVKIKAMERDAVDQSAELRAAETQLKDATAEVDRQWDHYVDTQLSHDQMWTSAVRERDAAAQAAKDADTELAAAQAQARSAGTMMPGQTSRHTSSYGSSRSSRSSSSSSHSSRRSSGY